MSKKIKLIGTIFAIIIIWFSFNLISNAASFSASISKTTVNVGDTFTVTVRANNAAGMYSVSTSNSNVSLASGSASEFLENGSTTLTYKANKVGEVDITASASDMTDLDNDTIPVTGTKRFTVTVNAKSSSSSGSSNKPSNSSSKNKTTTTSNAPSFTSVNETVYATDSVNVRSSYSTSSSVIGSLEKGDSITRTGKSSSWSRVTYNGKTAYISSNYLTTKKPEKSTNKDLKELTVKGDYKITPEFSKDVTEYDLTVGEDVESIEINAVPDDDLAKVEITGKDKLLMGINTVEIKVTAEDGTEKTYKINVTRGKVEPLGLSELTIEGYTLSPEFDKEVYKYTLDIADLSVTRLNINAISNMENATIEITGEDALIQGENVITILVKSEDGQNTATYQITVNIHEPVKEQLIAGIDDEDLFLYGGIALGVIIVIIIIIVIVRHNRKKDDDFGTYYGGFDSLNRDEKKDTNNFNEEDKMDYKTNINSDNEKDTNLNSNASTSLNDGVETYSNNAKEDYRSNNSESNVEDETKSHRKSVIEENFGADIDMNRFYDDKPRRRKGKHF